MERDKRIRFKRYRTVITKRIARILNLFILRFFNIKIIYVFDLEEDKKHFERFNLYYGIDKKDWDNNGKIYEKYKHL